MVIPSSPLVWILCTDNCNLSIYVSIYKLINDMHNVRKPSFLGIKMCCIIYLFIAWNSRYYFFTLLDHNICVTFKDKTHFFILIVSKKKTIPVRVSTLHNCLLNCLRVFSVGLTLLFKLGRFYYCFFNGKMSCLNVSGKYILYYLKLVKQYHSLQVLLSNVDFLEAILVSNNIRGDLTANKI